MSKSKKYKGKACAYCAVEGISTTGDHVFAREFFPIDKRANLLQVPACGRCNGDKSALEHYLTAVLPFGGQHADAHHVLNEMVEPRLSKNAKLQKALNAGRETVWERVGGLLAPAMRLPFDTEKLSALCGMIAKGLALHHFGVVIPADCNVISGPLTAHGDEVFGRFLAMKGNRVSQSVGGGAFAYDGVQSRQNEHLTIWRFSVYGGVRLGGDPQAPHEEGRYVWVTTSKSRVFIELREFAPA
jgi:hypothetical protein